MSRIGIAISGGPNPAEIIDLVILAESLGYESAWVAEGHGGDQFAILAACATRPSTMLDGYVFRPPGSGKHPALVFLHGCDGLFDRATGLIGRRERDWAAELTRRGYVVLMVDSFGAPNRGKMCPQRGFDRELYLKRPRDAYGALLLLQAQPFVQADRVGVIGWSQG